MTPFEHLAVLISIVLGLGLTHLLTSVPRLVEARQRVRLYWLPLLWVALIFVSLIGWWWASFALRQHAVWSFFCFLFVLRSPVSLYLAAAFGWFLAMLGASPVLDAVRRAVEANRWTDFGALSNAVSAVLVGSLAPSRRPWHHAVVTVVVGALFRSFIVDAAHQLR